jgi:molecular chaperone DnaK
MDTILGIDLGTTNSVVSILRDKQPYVIPVEGNFQLLPSAVGVDDDGNVIVGTPARNLAMLGPHRSILSVKRRMGSDEQMMLGQQSLTPQEVSAIVLRTLKQRAEEHLGHAVSKAVITVPAFFNDNQRQATRQAGELAGMEVLRIINEPTAAALTYQTGTQENRRLLVYDLGGGTFDVSVVQVEQGVVEVLSSHGDTKLGGDDFDQLLLDYVCDDFKEEHGIDLRDIPAARSRLRNSVEEAKKRLSDEAFTSVEEAFIAEQDGKPLNLSLIVDRRDYENIIQGLVAKTIDSVDRALEDAKLYAKDIDTVILVGGSTRTPLVQRVVEEKLGQPPLCSVDPDMCVAMGAAIQGGLISGLDVGSVLVDITPHTLGIRCVSWKDGIPVDTHFARMISRNTSLPAKRSHLFQKVHEGQRVAEIDVYQGENDDATLNELVGSFRLEGLDESVDASREILVRFELDLNGTLTATAVERATSLEKSLRIDNAITRFRAENQADAKQKIARVLGLTAPDALAPEDGGVSLSASLSPDMSPATREQRLIDQAESLLEVASQQDREEMKQLVDALRNAVSAQDEDEITSIAEKLEDILFYVKDA